MRGAGSTETTLAPDFKAVEAIRARELVEDAVRRLDGQEVVEQSHVVGILQPASLDVHDLGGFVAVTHHLFDVLGREVAVLVDTQKEAGEYEAFFQAGSLPAGIYLAQIQFDYLRFTRRMMLIR